jgi:hypothetical protein
MTFGCPTRASFRLRGLRQAGRRVRPDFMDGCFLGTGAAAIAGGSAGSGFYLRSQFIISFGCIEIARPCLPVPGYVSKRSAFLSSPSQIFSVFVRLSDLALHASASFAVGGSATGLSVTGNSQG